ncbi:TadE/TadG family type IV pilus assembly protein [Planctomycetes bacterium TBK1r]|uniref:TadE-like protein n=1 Tax=Stieleria magnilauensis TaxID=2527963 RepID=A0ABX5XNJ7_9BACT|nr:TadE-like protein [Planctomycetes bacterium TBK1r]
MNALRRRRKGAAAVEFALVAPFLILLVLGIIEFGRGMMVQQLLTNASREGAREAALPDATADSVKQKVVEFLSDASVSVSPSDVTVDPDPSAAFDNEQITVKVEVGYNEIGWINGSFLNGVTLSATTKMRSERLD